MIAANMVIVFVMSCIAPSAIRGLKSWYVQWSSVFRFFILKVFVEFVEYKVYVNIS